MAAADRQQHQPLHHHHHGAMNVETNLDEYDDDDDDYEKEQKDQHANVVAVIGHPSSKNSHEQQREQQSPPDTNTKTRRIGGRRRRRQRQQQPPTNNKSSQSPEQPKRNENCCTNDQNSKSSDNENLPSVQPVLMSPQQQQQPRRQRQRIVIHFDPVEMLQEEEEQPLVVTTTATTTAPHATASSNSTSTEQAQQQKDKNGPEAPAVCSSPGSSLSKQSSSFFSSEWLLTAPTSPITTATAYTNSILSQQNSTRSTGTGHEDEDEDDIPTTSVCGIDMDTAGDLVAAAAADADDSNTSMSQSALRLLFHSESNLLSLGGGTTTDPNKENQQTDADREDDDGDAESVQSAPYFDPSDFAPIHWAQALTEHEVMVGLAAVVAITTISLTHPLLFLAVGSLTALGTATAVGAGYDFLMEGPIGRCLHGSGTAGTSAVGCYRRDSTTSTASSSIPLDATTTTTQEPGEATKTTRVANVGPTVTALKARGVTDAVDAGNRAPVSTASMAQRPENPRSDSAASSSALGTADVTANGTGGAEQTLPDNWIDVHYPPLEHALCGDKKSPSASSSSCCEFQGLDVLQFFRVFLCDKAPYTYMEFQKKRGDKDIEYGLWKELPQSGPLSMHPAAVAGAAASSSTTSSSFPLAEVDYVDYQSRVLNFKTKTNNSFLGPPYATTTKEQRILMVNKRLAILEMKTTLADIPFCDRFFVMERWIIQAEKVTNGLEQAKLQPHHNGSIKPHSSHHYYQCRLTNASCQVFFQKSCPFETQIRTKSYASIDDVTTAWCHMATQAVLLAEKAKLDRLMAERQHEEELVDADGVEGFAEEKKDEDTASCRDSSKTNGAASQLSVRGAVYGDNDHKRSLDVDSIEVMRSPSHKHACVVVQDYHSTTGHHHHHKIRSNDNEEIPDVVRIPAIPAIPGGQEEQEVEKKVIRIVRPWNFKFRGRSSRQASSVSSRSFSSRQHQSQGALAENTSTCNSKSSKRHGDDDGSQRQTAVSENASTCCNSHGSRLED